MNEAERVSIKSTIDAAIQQAEDADAINLDANMKTLYDAASVLRKALNNTEKWEFTGSLTDVTEKHLPKGVYSFFRWVVQGPNTTLTSDKKSSAVNQRAMSLSQSTMSMFLSERQAQNTKTQTLRLNHEMPQQVAIGLTIHQATRSKKIVNILHGFGISVEYNRILRLETQMARSVLERMLLMIWSTSHLI